MESIIWIHRTFCRLHKQLTTAFSFLFLRWCSHFHKVFCLGSQHQTRLKRRIRGCPLRAHDRLVHLKDITQTKHHPNRIHPTHCKFFMLPVRTCHRLSIICNLYGADSSWVSTSSTHHGASSGAKTETFFPLPPSLAHISCSNRTYQQRKRPTQFNLGQRAKTEVSWLSRARTLHSSCETGGGNHVQNPRRKLIIFKLWVKSVKVHLGTMITKDIVDLVNILLARHNCQVSAHA